MVIQEPGPPPAPVKEATPSDGGDLNTPKSKGSSNKGARSGRRRGRSGVSVAPPLTSSRDYKGASCHPPGSARQTETR